jgi:hypothetical protein
MATILPDSGAHNCSSHMKMSASSQSRALPAPIACAAARGTEKLWDGLPARFLHQAHDREVLVAAGIFH